MKDHVINNTNCFWRPTKGDQCPPNYQDYAPSLNKTYCLTGSHVIRYPGIINQHGHDSSNITVSSVKSTDLKSGSEPSNFQYPLYLDPEKSDNPLFGKG